MHGLEAEFAGQIGFVYLDIDDPANDVFKQSLVYRAQPHLFLLDGEGKVVKQWLGPVTADELRSAFQAVLQ